MPAADSNDSRHSATHFAIAKRRPRLQPTDGAHHAVRSHWCDEGRPDAKKVPLTKWFSLTGNKSCLYEYGFGDGWLHDVRLETVEQHDGAWKRRLLDGARAFPPEDCGGLGGYEACLETAAGDDDPHELKEWLDDWNPEHFNLVATKRRFDK